MAIITIIMTKMWGMKTEIIQKKHMEKHMEKIPGAISINELQKITLLGTAHKLSKGLPQILSALLFNSTMVWIQPFRS